MYIKKLGLDLKSGDYISLVFSILIAKGYRDQQTLFPNDQFESNLDDIATLWCHRKFISCLLNFLLKDILFICVWVEVFKDNKTTGSIFFYDFGAFLLQCQIFQLRHSCLVLSHNKSMVFSEQPEPCPFFCTARCYLSFLSHTHGNGSLNIAKFH